MAHVGGRAVVAKIGIPRARSVTGGATAYNYTIGTCGKVLVVGIVEAEGLTDGF